MELVILPNGAIRCVYDEAIELTALGPLEIRRASHVEPTVDGTWTADLSPVGGPIVGPFPLRTDALDAEARWLASHWLIAD